MCVERVRSRLLGAAVLILITTGVSAAQGQGCPRPLFGDLGTTATNLNRLCPALFSPNPRIHLGRSGCDRYYVGSSKLQLFNRTSDRQFCEPTLIPGSCYGHFQTKWRKWEDHCPSGDGACAAPDGAVNGEPVHVAPAPNLPAVSVPAVPTPSVPTPAVPGLTPPVNTADPVAPPKVPAVPKQVSATRPAGELLPPVAPSQSTPTGEPQRVIVPPLVEAPRIK